MYPPSGRSHLPLSLSNTGLGVGAGAVWFVAVTVGGGGGNGVSSFFPQEERMPAARMVIRRLFDFIVTLSRSRYRILAAWGGRAGESGRSEPQASNKLPTWFQRACNHGGIMAVPRWHGGTTPHGGAAPVAHWPRCQGSCSGFHQDG